MPGLALQGSEQTEQRWLSPAQELMLFGGRQALSGEPQQVPTSKPPSAELGQGPGQGATGPLGCMQQAFCLGLAVPGAHFTKKCISATERRALDNRQNYVLRTTPDPLQG